MKRIFSTTVALALMAIFISSAQAAIKIEVATVQNGVAFIKGKRAVKGAAITWEGFSVTTANKNNGGFSFFGILPDDCTGELKDGAETVPVAVLNCTPAPEPAGGVLKTGQTTSFAAGDDGDLEKGLSTSPDPRFTDNGDGTITDNLTGLIWLKNANCPAGTRNWQGALDFVAGINNMGLNNCGDISNGGLNQIDWRLPNRNELTSLLDLGTFSPALPAGHPFTSFQVSGYWSSTTGAFNSINAWVVTFILGSVNGNFKNGSGFVLAVRGGS